MILVTGATGRLGRLVVPALTAAGFSVRATSRDPARLASLPAESEWRSADLRRSLTLPSLFDGVSRVVLISPVEPDMVTCQANLIRAAHRAGVKRLVKVSMVAASPKAGSRFARWHGEVESVLADSGLAHTCLRPHFLMQNLLRYAGSVRDQDQIVCPFEQAPLAMVDGRDVAAAIVAAMQRPTLDPVYTLTGPEAISFDQVAESIGELVGRSILCQPVAVPVVRRAIVDVGYPDWWADGIAEVCDWLRSGQGNGVSDGMKRLTDIPARPLSRFLQDHATAWKG